MSYLIEPHSERRFAADRLPLPAIIHGAEGSGASFATVVLAAELIRVGRAVVCLCRRSTAVRALQTELGIVPPSVRTREVTAAVAWPLSHSRLVTMHGPPDFLLRSLRALPDWSARVVIIKNIETTISTALWEVVAKQSTLILSGDFSRATISIQPERWPTIIGFSTFPRAWKKELLPAPPYVGTIQTGKRTENILAIDRRQKTGEQTI